MRPNSQIISLLQAPSGSLGIFLGAVSLLVWNNTKGDDEFLLRLIKDAALGLSWATNSRVNCYKINTEFDTNEFGTELTRVLRLADEDSKKNVERYLVEDLNRTLTVTVTRSNIRSTSRSENRGQIETPFLMECLSLEQGFRCVLALNASHIPLCEDLEVLLDAPPPCKQDYSFIIGPNNAKATLSRNVKDCVNAISEAAELCSSHSDIQKIDSLYRELRNQLEAIAGKL